VALTAPVPAAALQGWHRPLERLTTAERVADGLRERILLGDLRAGSQCAEQQWAVSLGVSRNTLREAFQILVGERLLVREPYRGVFVRRLDVADLADIYTFRRIVKCAAIAQLAEPRGLAEMRVAVQDGHAAALREDWFDVGTADVRFHMAITAVAGSPRLDRAMRGLFAELRLAFQLVVVNPQAVHAPYLERNAEILELAESGHGQRASRRLRQYLDDAEAVVVAAVRRA